MNMFGKNVFSKDAGIIANLFGVIATIWLLPVIIVFFLMDYMFTEMPTKIRKYIKKKRG